MVNRFSRLKKKDQNVNIDRNKCRLDLRDFSQREGIDCKEIYVPVNVIARENLAACQMDVQCAFSRAELTDYKLCMFLSKGTTKRQAK